VPAEPEPPRLHVPDTDQSGLYRVSYGAPRRELVFAVNVPAAGPTGSESDLRRLTAEDLKALTSEELQVVTEVGAIRRSPRRPQELDDTPADMPQARSSPRGPGLARIALLTLFGLLVLEAVLAWRFGAARAGHVTALDQPQDTHWRRARDRLYAALAAAPLAVCAMAGVLLVYAGAS